MKSSMHYDETDKAELIHSLCKLFSEININGEEKMKWRQFTQFIIDMIMQTNNKEYDNYKGPNQEEMLELAHSKKHFKLTRCSYIDSVIHDGLIHKVIFCPLLSRLLIVENQRHSIKFASLDLKCKDVVDLLSNDVDLLSNDEQVNPTNNNSPEKKLSYFVLSAAYSDQNHMVFLTQHHKQ